MYLRLGSPSSFFGRQSTLELLPGRWFDYGLERSRRMPRYRLPRILGMAVSYDVIEYVAGWLRSGIPSRALSTRMESGVRPSQLSAIDGRTVIQNLTVPPNLLRWNRTETFGRTINLFLISRCMPSFSSFLFLFPSLCLSFYLSPVSLILSSADEQFERFGLATEKKFLGDFSGNRIDSTSTFLKCHNGILI